MSRSDAHRLADMVMAIDEISAIVQRGRPAFDDDVVLRRAVERCLEIIGEAAKSVSPAVTEAHPEIPWSDMAKVRDRLSHHYTGSIRASCGRLLPSTWPRPRPTFGLSRRRCDGAAIQAVSEH